MSALKVVFVGTASSSPIRRITVLFELMKAQSALRDEQELLRLAMHNAKMASWDYDCKNHRLLHLLYTELSLSYFVVIDKVQL